MADDEAANGRATIREVHSLLKETRNEIMAELEDIREYQRDTSRRVSSLERGRAYVAGAAAVLATGTPILITLVWGR